MKLKLLVLSAIFLISNVCSAESAEKYESEFKSKIRSPLGCKNVGYNFQLNVVNILPEDVGDRQSLYFVYNRLNKPVKLFQMLKSSSTRSTYLNHEIRPNQWAVLATGEKEIKYICTVADKKSVHGKVVDCSKSLKICEYARVKFGMNNRGNYWLVKNASRGRAVGDVVRYGIIPR
ncbi:MAG: endopeptidase IV [Legionellaceae bacterium]|nr:endopeptidase IV [Legionellaceae bacterium]